MIAFEKVALQKEEDCAACHLGHAIQWRKGDKIGG